MAGQMRINTDQVEQIATNIENLNTKLKTELENSKAVIDGLSSTWEGEAYEATKAAYAEFQNKYFQNYEDVIKQYINFLRTNVAQGYFDTETANTTLADSFK